MDLSKLPRMSNTPDERPADAPAELATPTAPPPPRPPRDESAVVYERRGAATAPVETGGGGEAWLSLIVGFVYLYLGQRFGGWLLATLTGQVYDHGVTWQPPHPRAGELVPYWSLNTAQGAPFAALSDCALFVFGVALLLEAVVMLAASRAKPSTLRLAAGVAFVVTGLAVLLNLGTIVKFIADGAPLALLSVIAVGFGGFMCASLLRTWSALAPPKP